MSFIEDGFQKIISDLKEKNHRLELEINYFRMACKEKDDLIDSLREDLKTMDDFALGKNRRKKPDGNPF